MEEVGAAIKEIIHYYTIRGKFSSVHPDLAAEGITRVEVGEEGLHFIANQPGETGSKSSKISVPEYGSTFNLSDGAKAMIGRLQAPGDDEENEEMLRRAIAMSLEEGP